MELCKVIGVDEPDLKVAFRLGNPKEGVVRPLKVVMNNKKHRKNILDNASKLKQLPHTSECVKCIIAKDLTMRQRELNKNRREEKKRDKAKSAKKNPELSDNSYDEETICHVTSKIVTPATIENVYLKNMDRLDMSYHQYQSQPILAPICRFEAPNDHIMNMLPEMNE